MPATVSNGYCTLPELKAALEITGDEQDGRLKIAIEATSRYIDGATGFTFYASGSEARYFTAADYDELTIDPAISVSAVAVDSAYDRTYSVSFAAGDYETYSPDPAGPIRRLLITPNGSYRFPLGRRAVKVTGVWGYAAAPPPPIRQACLLLSQRLFKRADAIFGIAGAPAAGTLIVQARIEADADIESLLRGYRRLS